MNSGIMGKKFEKLRRKVTSEYIKKGYSRKTATAWGYATAGKVYRNKKKRR